MAPETPEPKKRKTPSGKSPLVFPISDSPPSSSPRVVARPAARGKAKNVRGTTKIKTCENPVAFPISDFPSSSSSRVVTPPAARGKAKSVRGTRKMKPCEKPVAFPISDFPSSSSSRLVTPPATSWKAKSVRGTRNMKTSDNPVVDPIVIGENECDKPESLELSLSCCDICAETVHEVEMVKVSVECSHSFCASCVIKHVETKILENVTDVKCLGSDCGSVIEVDICRGFLDGKLLERWEKLRCEAAFEEAQKYYCPFKDCSAMLIVDGEAGHLVRECECPYCHRLFCARCRVPWHWKYSCKQFQLMDEDERGNEDVLVKELAKKKKWGRCPKCRFYVERTMVAPTLLAGAASIFVMVVKKNGALVITMVAREADNLASDGNQAKLIRMINNASMDKEGNEVYPIEVLCEICADSKVSTDMLRVSNGCSHYFCGDCISKHVSAKVHENVTVIQCPELECVGILDMENCKGVVPEDLAIRWARASCEAMFLESQKFYCPFKSCSVMLVKNCDDEEKVRECECPHCHRLFCADCRVPWHTGVTCREYQALGEDERGREDLMVRELALVKKWRRCPNCKYFVERTHGCPHITCRCQFQFCYGCGASWDE